MIIFNKISSFLLNAWLWNVALDWHHLPVNFLIMFFLLYLFSSLNIVQIVLLSFCAQLYSFGIYSAFIVGVLVKTFNFSYVPDQQSFLIQPLNACVYLAIIYALLQITFFLMIKRRYNLSTFLTLVVPVLSNLLAAGFAYWLLPEIW
jgi:hypothetical protein